jgi:hypothetical protein
MEVDGVWNVALEIIGERRSHVNDPNRRMTGQGWQFSWFNQSGMVEIDEGGIFGREEGRKE